MKHGFSFGVSSGFAIPGPFLKGGFFFNEYHRPGAKKAIVLPPFFCCCDVFFFLRGMKWGFPLKWWVSPTAIWVFLKL